MKAQRPAEAGVTLIEMLAALAVSALIGVAGFTLLESVLQTESGVAGHLERVARQDRTFQILAIDLQQAQSARWRDGDGISLSYLSQTIIWRATDDGLERHIIESDRPDLVQTLLPDPAILSVEDTTPPLLTLRLPDADLWRVFHLPETRHEPQS